MSFRESFHLPFGRKGAGSDTSGGTAVAARPVRPRRKGRALLLLAAVVLAAAAGFYFLRKPGSGSGGLSRGELYTLQRGDLTVSINGTGTVGSTNTNFVYSTLSYPVKEIYVSVGDTVKKGDLLCVLDSTELRKNLQEKQLAAAGGGTVSYNTAIQTALSSMNAAYERLQQAQREYDTYQNQVAANITPEQVSADSGIESARQSLDTARSSYSYALQDYDAARAKWNETVSRYTPRADGTEAEQAYARITAQQLMLQEQYADALTVHQQALEEYQNLTQSHTAAADRLDAAGKAMDAASLTLSNLSDALLLAGGEMSTSAKALSGILSALVTFSSGKLTNYANDVQAAFTGYQTALQNLDNRALALGSAVRQYDLATRTFTRTSTDADEKAQSLTDALNTAKRTYEEARVSYETAVAAAQLDLDQLQQDLENCSIYAPADGTVTASYVAVGKNVASISSAGASAGLMFVIEDIGDLVINCKVKEYNIASLQVGTPVQITSEAAGAETYEGTVSFIAPTSTKNDSGQSIQTNTAEFEVKVQVDSPDTKLRIGTGASLRFVLSEQEDCLTVPYEALYTNESGQSCVLVAQTDSSGTQAKLVECPVETGLENDSYVAVQPVESGALAEGAQLITVPQSYLGQRGQTVPVSSGFARTGPTEEMFSLGGMLY